MMGFTKIESVFSDFIIDMVGPTKEREQERNEKFLIVKEIIESSLRKHFKKYIPHVFSYGSFPIKTYMKDADIDITVIFEDAKSHKLLLKLSSEQINNSILAISKGFEEYNKKMNSDIFTDSSIIYAEVRLLKCKFDDLLLDVSINNLSGLLKVMFISYINQKYGEHLKNHSLFKRTLLLIKAWGYYEGVIIGSNVGLMASYALEILVIFIFNNYSHLFNSEVEAFFTFFHVLGEMDWEAEALHLFGKLKLKSFSEMLESVLTRNEKEIEPFWYLASENIKGSPCVLDFDDIQSFIKEIQNIIEKDEEKDYSSSFLIRMINISDPLNSLNNLGKSINSHNCAKIKKLIKLVNEEIDYIIKIREKNDPLLYMNYLLKLFEKTLKNNFVGFFSQKLNDPTLLIKFNDKKEARIPLTDSEIEKFNLLFPIPKPKELQPPEKIKYENFDFIITKEIYDKLIEEAKDVKKCVEKLFLLEGNTKEVFDFFSRFGYLKK